MMSCEGLETLAAKMTPGPWSYEPEDYSPDMVRSGHGLIAQVIGDSAETQDNARGIVALRNEATSLLAIRKAAERLCEVYRDQPLFDNGKAMQALRAALKGDGR
jgi:hypothetical protein